MLVEADFHHHFVGACGRIAHFHHVVVHKIGVIEHVVHRRRVEGGAFQLDHVVLPPHQRRESVGIAAAFALFCAPRRHVAGAKTQQRHALHAEGGDHHFAGFAVGHGAIVLTDDFHDHQLGVHVATHPVRALREGGAHLGRGVGGEQLYLRPALGDATSEQIEGEMLIAQPFADADDPPNARTPVVDAVFVGILQQTEDERRHAHEGVGANAPNRFPLQLGNAVAHAHHARTEPTQSEKVGHAGHETLVERGHQLDYAVAVHAGAGKRLGFVEGQAL